MKRIRVVLYGAGVIGCMIGKFLLKKEGVEIVGAIDIAKDKIGKDLSKFLGTRKRLGIEVSDDTDRVLSETKPHIVIHTTTSFLKTTYSQIASIVKHGVNVVSTCEELSYPCLTHPKLAKRLDSLAKQHDATILGTGINPGFLMDALVIMLTAPCQKIDGIRVTRLMNAATRRLPFQKKIGAGLTLREFKRKIERKEITGHVGLEQSAAMIADVLAWRLDDIIVERVKPVIAKKAVESKDIRVKAGNVAGLRQRAKGLMKGKEAIVLDFQAFIGAEEECDAITIAGLPTIKQRIQPCVHGDTGTIAMVINSIPKVISAPAGLLTMKDISIPSAAIENMTKYVSPLNRRQGDSVGKKGRHKL